MVLLKPRSVCIHASCLRKQNGHKEAEFVAEFDINKSPVWALQVSNEGTYQEVVRATCGKVTGVLCEIAIAVYTFGTCIAFFIVIGDQLDRCK